MSNEQMTSVIVDATPEKDAFIRGKVFGWNDACLQIIDNFKQQIETTKGAIHKDDPTFAFKVMEINTLNKAIEYIKSLIKYPTNEI